MTYRSSSIIIKSLCIYDVILNW